MTQEFRLSVNIKLPEDDFERAAALVQSGKLKGAIAKALEEHQLTGAVTHEIVTPRGPNAAKVIPAAPASQSSEVPGGLGDLNQQTTNADLSGLGAAMTNAPIAGEPTPFPASRRGHGGEPKTAA